MIITRNMLFYWMKKRWPHAINADEALPWKANVSRPMFWSSAQEMRGHLVVIDPIRLKHIDRFYPDTVFVCIGGDAQRPRNDNEIIIVPDEDKMEKAFNYLATIFDKFYSWAAQLDQASDEFFSYDAIIRSCEAVMDDPLALLDADFTKTVPAKITADTGLDVLTHALEAYVSNTATSFTDALAVKALRIVFEDLPVVYRDGLAMRSRARMIEASCAAGIAFTNAGLGINHSIAHALGGRFHVAHGRLNAVLLPYVMRFHMAEAKYREPYDRLAHELGLADAEALLAKIVEIRHTLGVESSLSELPIMPGDFEAAVSDIAEAAQHDRCTPTNVRPVSKQDLVNIARDAYYGC